VEAVDELKVLLIEDDPAVAEMYRRRLEIDGYQVAVAPDGETGVRMALADRPDLVYLDLRLPTIDGFAVLEQLRGDERTSGIPVVILSNYSEPEQVDRGRRLGALDYLVKAETSPSALTERMQNWLRDEALVPRVKPA
jgi:DNA-binding response OmpR family regulator